MRIALIADTHLSTRSPECTANWHAARRAVQRLSPDLTVHLGDITLDGQSHPEELLFSARLLQQWPTELRCVAGNHDVGDGSGESPLDERLLANYQNLFGPDHWSQNTGNWLLLGINAQLLGSGTEQESAQWRWIEDRAARAGAERTALFLHRPLLRPVPDESTRKGRYVARDACQRLLQGPLRASLRLVVSGHTHQYLDVTADGVRHVWMPSTAFVIPDGMQVRVGEKLVGIGLLEFRGQEVDFDLWCPDGMVRHEVSKMQAFKRMEEAA